MLSFCCLESRSALLEVLSKRWHADDCTRLLLACSVSWLMAVTRLGLQRLRCTPLWLARAAPGFLGAALVFELNSLLFCVFNSFLVLFLSACFLATDCVCHWD